MKSIQTALVNFDNIIQSTCKLGTAQALINHAYRMYEEYIELDRELGRTRTMGLFLRMSGKYKLLKVKVERALKSLEHWMNSCRLHFLRMHPLRSAEFWEY